MEPGGGVLIPGITGLPITGVGATGFGATGLPITGVGATGLGLKIAISDHPSTSFATLSDAIATARRGDLAALFHLDGGCCCGVLFHLCSICCTRVNLN
jgi:hypothetical protein